MVPQQRGKALHEEPSVYETKKEVLIEELFNTVPMP